MSTNFYATRTVAVAIVLQCPLALMCPLVAGAQPPSPQARDQELAARRRAVFAEDEFLTPFGEIADPNAVLMPPPQTVEPNATRAWPTITPDPTHFGPALPRRYSAPYRFDIFRRGQGMYRPRFNNVGGFYPGLRTRAYNYSPNTHNY